MIIKFLILAAVVLFVTLFTVEYLDAKEKP